MPDEQEDKKPQNLIPWIWKPGQSGNPSGMAKGTIQRRTIAKRLQALLDEPARAEEFLSPEAARRVAAMFPDLTGATVADLLCMRVITTAAMGDAKTSLRAFKEIIDRMEGTSQKNITIDTTRRVEFYTLNISDDSSDDDLIDITNQIDEQDSDGAKTQAEDHKTESG